jgi:hypothetical protein
MDPFLASSFGIAILVLFAGFGLAEPERRRPLLIGAAGVVGVILIVQTLVGLFGAQTARLTFLAAAFLGMVGVVALVWRRRQPS